MSIQLEQIKHPEIISLFKRADETGSAKTSTCSARNWDILKHTEMSRIYHNGITGFSICLEINFGVNDYFVTKLF